MCLCLFLFHEHLYENGFIKDGFTIATGALISTLSGSILYHREPLTRQCVQIGLNLFLALIYLNNSHNISGFSAKTTMECLYVNLSLHFLRILEAGSICRHQPHPWMKPSGHQNLDLQGTEIGLKGILNLPNSLFAVFVTTPLVDFQ